MADLVVLGFPSKEKADEVLALSGRLVQEDLLDLEDAAVVYRRDDGKLKIEQTMSATGMGAASGALWGTLFGLLFLMPVFGLAVGAASGALAGKLADVGIDDGFMKDVAAQLQPGTAAVFALVRHSTPDRVREALRLYHPTVIQTSLSHDDEEELVKALAT
ncbi:MAG: DUF1269 domain-containing protein [Actinomycetes bacterium]